ncbi:MAG TPA: class I SAM-dependent methyltransferase [Bryobacteraceae bacterium]|nr:class I SAM-dependent methyltransferase [Bryobacteraceae bacterium]
MNPAQAFDALAAGYDKLWTCSPAGRLQREAFWDHAGPCFRNATRVLDLGCGAGEDALGLMRSGMRVTAIDVSPRMVAVARARGVNARELAMERLGEIAGRFDVAMSNFGALNCLESPAILREPLARLVVPGGYAIFCVLGRFCLWETAWFLLHGHLGKARRRWRGKSRASMGIDVYYHSPARMRENLWPDFTLEGHFGIGICVPPSYVRCVSNGAMRRAAQMDETLAEKKLWRAVADHQLFIFRRRK